jgi:hypothetical protein
MHRTGPLRGSGHQGANCRHGRALPHPVAQGRVRQPKSSPPHKAGGWRRRRAVGVAARSRSRRRVDLRSGVHRRAGSELGSSPGRPRPAWPRSGSSSDAWRSPRRSRPNARTGPACSVTSLGKSRTAAYTTVTCLPSRSRSTPSTRCSVAGSSPAWASPHRRHGPIDRGDVPGARGDRPPGRLHPRGASRPERGPRTGARRKLRIVLPWLSPNGRNWRLLPGTFRPGRRRPDGDEV